MLRRELGLDAELVEGHYGEFTVLVDDQPVVRGGALTFIGIIPSLRRVREVIERSLESELALDEQRKQLMSEGKDSVTPGKSPKRLGAWAWVAFGLIVGAIAGWAAGNLAAGFGVGAALGITFAYALRGRNPQ